MVVGAGRRAARPYRSRAHSLRCILRIDQRYLWLRKGSYSWINPQEGEEEDDQKGLQADQIESQDL